MRLRVCGCAQAFFIRGMISYSPIRLPQEQGYASFSPFYISAGFHIFSVSSLASFIGTFMFLTITDSSLRMIALLLILLF